MRTLTLILMLCVLALPEAYAGTIVGAVRAEGKHGTEADASDGKYASHQFKFVERINYSELHDFIVYIDELVVTNVAPRTEQVVTRRITQKGAMFTPHVTRLGRHNG